MTDASTSASPADKPAGGERPPAAASSAPPLIPLGAIATVLGIAACMLVDPTFGGVLVVAGILTQAWGLHRLGRSGH